jgi:flagellar hook-associated protein 2
VGSGTLTLAVGSADAFDVSVAAGTTLTELRDAINEAAEAAGVGLTATLVDGQHLVLTADDTGAGNAITVSVSGAAGDLANLVYDPALAPDDPAQLMSQVQAAQDALVDVDGVTGITRAGNTLSDVLEGVTLNLAGADPGQTVDLTVSQDLDTITSAVQDFAEAYNTFLDTVDTLRLGELSGDSTVRNAESLLRGVLNTPAQGLGLSYLSEVGVSFQLTDVERADGTTAKRLEMEVDAGQLGSALSQDPEAVTALFTDTQQGFGARLNTLLGDMLGEGGLIDGRTDGLHAETARIDDRILGMERRLLTTEQGLRREFTTLDALVGSLTATSEFLTQQLASLPGVVNDQSG